MSIRKTHTEKELLDAFASGEPRAFEEIYDEYFSRIYLYARKLIDDGEEAKDIVISAFAKLFARSRDFDNLPEIRGFLYTCARNSCYNFLKQQHRKDAAEKELFLHLENSDDFLNSQVEGEAVATLYRALHQLPPSSKKVLELIYIQGMKYAEVASAMNISVETVKSQRSYAIRKLRELLSGNPHLFFLLAHLVAVLQKK